MPWSGCKSLRRLPSGRGEAQGCAERAALQGRCLRPYPISRKEYAEGTAMRRFTAGCPGRQGGGDGATLARAPVMSLQSSKEHKVNGMPTTAVCSPHPHPLPGGARGLLSASINLWGTLSPQGEGESHFAITAL